MSDCSCPAAPADALDVEITEFANVEAAFCALKIMSSAPGKRGIAFNDDDRFDCVDDAGAILLLIG